MFIRFLSALVLVAAPQVAAAQDSPVPDRRIITQMGQDYYGGDIGSIFETTFQNCRRACYENSACTALTYNTSAEACFLKNDIEKITPFDGAISARMVQTPENTRKLAIERAPDLAFLPDQYLREARALAGSLGGRIAANANSEKSLLAAAALADRAGNMKGAAQNYAAAVTLSDDADTWRDLARAWFAQPGENNREKRRLTKDSVSAAINAYLRSDTDQSRATALNLLAQTLEGRGNGRQMIPALRLSQRLSPRQSTEEQLDYAVSNYGFRVVGHEVDSDAASPRICVEFSESLAEAGLDYAPYIRVEGQDNLPVEPNGQQLCVEGVAHGESYRFTVRSGLPSGTGETLRRSSDLDVYVRDRSPSVRFVGRAYVLPRGADAAIPVVSVNVSEVDLAIYRIGDRSLLPSIQDGLFDSAINKVTENRLRDSSGEAIWQGKGEVAGAVNADVTTALPIGEAIGQAKPGVYAMTARVPGDSDSDWERTATQWFVITDLGLASMSGADGVHGFVRSLSNADAVAGAKVRLIAKNNEILGELLSDASGYVRFPPGLARGTAGQAPALLTVERDGDFAFLDLAKPGFDLSDRGVEGRQAPGPIDVFATTERGVYRPGEVVHATVLARDATANALTDLPLTAIVTRPDGVEYQRTVLSDQGAGGRAHSLRLGTGVPRGTWRMNIHADPKAAPLAQVAFLVEDFIPEKIDFDLTAPEGPIRPDQPVTVSLNARYLYGAPGADLTVEGSVRVSAAEGLPGFPGYRFGLHDEQVNSSRDSIPTRTTDVNGDASFVLPVPTGDPGTKPLKLQAIVTVKDSSGRPVERTLDRPLTPTGTALGIKPLFDGQVEEGTVARFDLIAVGTDGQRTALPRVGWTVSRINRDWQWYEVNGRWNYEAIVSRERIASGEMAMTADGRITIEAPVEWGQYEVKIVSLEGDYTAASMTFNAGWYAIGGNTDTPDVLEVGLNRKAYQLGDTVQMRIKARNAGTALISVVDNRLIEMKSVALKQGENTVELTVDESWGPGAYVTASLIQPMDRAAGRNPARALGLGWAGVDPGPRKLGVAFTTPTELQPRGPIEVAVRIDAPAGEDAYVTLAAVDLGILNLTGFKTPDPDAHYFGQRKLGMEMRDLYGRLIDGMQGVRGRIRSGGDAEQARLKASPPTEELVAYFSGVVKVGPDGMARASFELPDFNGTVRLMATAWTPTGVGHGEQDVLVRDPVVVSVAVPRFMAPGDTSRILIDLAHAKGPAGEVTTQILGDGGIAIARDQAAQTVSLDQGQIRQIKADLTAAEIGDNKLRIVTRTPAGNDLLKTITLPVRLNDPEINRRNRIALPANGGRLVIDQNTFAGLETGTGRATLGVGPIAQFDAPGLLSALDRYPYGCTEQLTSRALPLLYFNEVAGALGMTAKADIAERVESAISKILANQSNAGSFGLWRPDRGDLWLDAYVSDFLSRAKAQGHRVPERAFQSALNNLRNALSYAGDFQQGGEDIAYALMVLAREGMASIGDLRYYADAKADALATPMAKAQLGAALAFYGEQRRADAMFRAAAEAALGAGADKGGWRMDYGSALRDRAAVLALAAEAGSNAINSARLTREIAQTVETRRYSSTQEKVWMLMATNALIDQQSGQITVDGAPVDGPMIRLFSDTTLAGGQVVIENTGPQVTDAVLTTYGVPRDPQPAGGHGYRIERQYFSIEGVAVDPASVPQNARLVAVLTVYSDADRTGRLMINDPLPAGLEIDNPNLLRAGAVDALDWLAPLDETAMSEFRADRFLSAVDRGGKGKFQLAYIVRAISPGTFHHPAATVEDMYRPEFRAWTGTGSVAITQGVK